MKKEKIKNEELKMKNDLALSWSKRALGLSKQVENMFDRRFFIL
jgi:hypothetical protein